MTDHYSPRQVAHAVCAVMGGSTVEAIMAPQRGNPRTAALRAVTMFVWRRHQDYEPHRNYTRVSEVFGRDRRNVARGLQRLERDGIPTRAELSAIVARLHAQ